MTVNEARKRMLEEFEKADKGLPHQHGKACAEFWRTYAAEQRRLAEEEIVRRAALILVSRPGFDFGV